MAGTLALVSSLVTSETASAALKSSSRAPGMQGDTATCAVDDVFASAKTSLQEVRVLSAVQLYEEHISIQCANGDIIVVSFIITDSLCDKLPITAPHISMGFADADLILSSSTDPTSGNVTIWVITC
ncbi:Leishmanolysin [Leishmania braziliensis MHOM/BR/75/M2904]|uniref:Leishmanolysin n=1 Tax=Leishmania braziliensis MHOM/BR/75/M2904 TaxID=420245 RepID=A0A3P3ZDY7_LEIBR|nr:Leishmanolysin [Leishmania braziliensis MHOM/BR/75/M2904]